MRTSRITREQALELLKTYNKEPFHIQHALTVDHFISSMPLQLRE